MINVKLPGLAGAAKQYAMYIKFAKFSFVRDAETKGTFSVSIPMLKVNIPLQVESDSNSEMDCVQKFCTEFAKVFS